MLKLLTFILGILPIIQATHASPVNIGDEKQLLVSAATTYIDFFGYTTEIYTELFEKVLTNSNVEAQSDPELKEALKPFAKFVTQMHSLPNKTRGTLQILFEECVELADKYDRGVPIEASQADKKIANYMNKAHALKTKFDVLIKYIYSLQHFANNVRKYLNAVPKEERMNQKKLKLWYSNWQREYDWEKKNDLMLNFFEIFDNSKNDRLRLNEKVKSNILIYLNTVVTAHKDLFKRVIKVVETQIQDLNDSAKHTVDMMTNFVNRAEKIQDLKDKEMTMELLSLFDIVQNRRKWYKSNNLTKDEQKVAKIMSTNGEVDVEVRRMLLTFGLSEELTKDVEDYFEVIPRQQMIEESKLMRWFEDVMDEKDYEVKAGKLVSLIKFLR